MATRSLVDRLFILFLVIGFQLLVPQIALPQSNETDEGMKVITRKDGTKVIIGGDGTVVQVCKDTATCKINDSMQDYVSALCSTPYGTCRVRGALANTPCSCKSLDRPPIAGTIVQEFGHISTYPKKGGVQAKSPSRQEEQSQKVRLLNQMIKLAEDNGGLEYKEEIISINKQIKSLPKPEKGNRSLARSLNEAGLNLAKEGNYKDAKKYFVDAQAQDPTDAEIIGNLGYAALRAGNYKQAIISFTESLQLVPSRAATWGNLGEYYAIVGKERKAIACFALAFHFSRNQEVTRTYLKNEAENNEDANVRKMAQQALELDLIKPE